VDWWLRHYWASLRDFSFVLLSFTGLRCLITSAHVPLHRAPHGIIREQYQQLALSEKPESVIIRGERPQVQ